MPRTQLIIALGANLPRGGDGPATTLRRAVRRLQGRGLRILRRSAFLRNPAQPPGSGPEFVNAVAAAEGPYSPTVTLVLLRCVERSLGRSALGRSGPRTLDLDLIDFGGRMRLPPDRWRFRARYELRSRSARSRVMLPHPGAHLRGFVLLPLQSILPTWRHPALGVGVRGLCRTLPAAAAAEKGGSHGT